MHKFRATAGVYRHPVKEKRNFEFYDPEISDIMNKWLFGDL